MVQVFGCIVSPSEKKGFSPKLSKPWVGPYLVIKRINDMVYRIQLNENSKPKVVHRNRLREYKGVHVPSFPVNERPGADVVMPPDVNEDVLMPSGVNEDVTTKKSHRKRAPDKLNL